MAEMGHSKSSSAGPAFGAIFTVVWVFAIGALFATLAGAFETGEYSSEELRTAAEPLIWPFISLALGVPIIVFVWFGGYAAILRLSDLKRHLEHLGSYATEFDRMAETAKDLNSNMGAASSSVAEASNQINSNFEKYETSIAPRIDQYFASIVKATENGPEKRWQDSNESLELEASGGLPGKKSSSEFDVLHQLANDMFYEALSRRNESPGRGRNQLVVARGGWNKAEIVRKLEEEQHFKTETAKGLIEVFELEVSSRRWGREQLDRNTIARLHKLLDDAWSQYQDSQKR